MSALGARLGLDLEGDGLGIVRIVNSNMVRAIRAVSIERGYDPRRFTLMPFGGAGALHAVDVARELGMTTLLVPPAPGILCAAGVSSALLEEGFVATCRTPLSEDLAVVADAFDACEPRPTTGSHARTRRALVASAFCCSTCATSVRISSCRFLSRRTGPALPRRRIWRKPSVTSTRPSTAMPTYMPPSRL